MASADQLISDLLKLEASTFANEAERVRARDALIATLRKVQTPWDLAWDHNWASVATNAAITTLIDAGVFTKWAAEAGGGPITPAKLAELTGADAQLLRRMLRTLAAQLLIREVSEDLYARTPWAIALAEDQSFASVYGGFYHEQNSPMFRTLPAYLRETGFQNPTDDTNCNFQYWQGDPGARFFDYVGAEPERVAYFNETMECHSRYNLTSWPELYPTETAVEAATAMPSDRPLVVDVGGGKGHDLRKFLAKHPNVPADNLVLQDLPKILEGVDNKVKGVKNEGTEAFTVQPYDFFKLQPRKGARIYLMHNVLHDWTDAKATQILKNTAEGMERGYSRLLIHESLVSTTQPLLRVCVSDLAMMACLAAHERTEAEWRGLIAGAGLCVVQIWRPPHSMESIIEAELA